MTEARSAAGTQTAKFVPVAPFAKMDAELFVKPKVIVLVKKIKIVAQRAEVRRL